MAIVSCPCRFRLWAGKGAADEIAANAAQVRKIIDETRASPHPPVS